MIFLEKNLSIFDFVFVHTSISSLIEDYLLQWKPVKVTPLKVNNRFTSTAGVGPVFYALYFSNLNPDNVNHFRPLSG